MNSVENTFIRQTRLLLFFLLLGVSINNQAQVYKASNMSGANESFPNTSTGIGDAIVEITDNSMRVQVSFSGLVSPTTFAHIHAPTTSPETGTAGVASQTPSFSGFPTGVTGGSYDMTFDMTQASSYNASFITANGGTPAGAFVALKTALNERRAYLNIHTSMYPAGEIRSFFIPDSYRNLTSMATFNQLAAAVGSALPGDIIQQINDATEMAPLEFPVGLILDLKTPFIFTVYIP